MWLFDAYLVIDWSAKGSPSRVKPTKDAVWVGEKAVDEDGIADESSERFFRTRALYGSCLESVAEPCKRRAEGFHRTLRRDHE